MYVKIRIDEQIKLTLDFRYLLHELCFRSYMDEITDENQGNRLVSNECLQAQKNNFIHNKSAEKRSLFMNIHSLLKLSTSGGFRLRKILNFRCFFVTTIFNMALPPKVVQLLSFEFICFESRTALYIFMHRSKFRHRYVAF